MTDYEEFMRINKDWIAAGRPAHQAAVETEFYLGSRTGDVACRVCGESWDPKTTTHAEVSVEH